MAVNGRWHPRRLLRFNIGTLLFVMLALSVGLGGYAAGRRSGERQLRAETFVVKTYPLADVIGVLPDDATRQALFDEVIEHLVTNVSPQTWIEAGAAEEGGEIQPFLTNASLVVNQSGAVHDEITTTLTKFCDERTRTQFDQAIATIDALAIEERSEPVVLVSFPNGGDLALAAVETSYDRLVSRLKKDWGTPRFSGQCFERGFPYWSLAQSITQWSKKSGDVYIAIEDRPGVGRVVIGGWRERE
jgi:hypothetical protein